MEHASVGIAENQPVELALNRRGMPARVRKPNPQFFDNDSIEVDFPGKRRRPSEDPSAQSAMRRTASSKSNAKVEKFASPKKTLPRYVEKPGSSSEEDDPLPDLELSRITRLEEELEKCVDNISTVAEGETRNDVEPVCANETDLGPRFSPNLARRIKKKGGVKIKFVPSQSDSFGIDGGVPLRDVKDAKSCVNGITSETRKSRRKIRPSRWLEDAQLVFPGKVGSSSKSSLGDGKPSSLSKKQIFVRKSIPSVKNSSCVKMISESSSTSEDDCSSDADFTPDTIYNPLRALLSRRAAEMPSAMKSKEKPSESEKEPTSSVEDSSGVQEGDVLIEGNFELTEPSRVADGQLPQPSLKKKQPATISSGHSELLTQENYDSTELSSVADGQLPQPLPKKKQPAVAISFVPGERWTQNNPESTEPSSESHGQFSHRTLNEQRAVTISLDPGERFTQDGFESTGPSSVANSPLPASSLLKKRKKKPTIAISFGPGKRLTQRRKQELLAAAEAEAMRQKATHIAKRLQNFLKLPKAHRWISYEFFYSHIDRTLFLHENEFLTCLRDVFPKLADVPSLKLTRMEWSFIRRTFGKPRRCSQVFFAEERRRLEQKREKIRQLQARENFPDWNSGYVPEMIPIPMSIGMRVTAKLFAPLSGLYDGVLQAIDTRNRTFRIKFDRLDVGLRTVEDYNVALAPGQAFLMMRVNQYLGKIRRPANAAGTVVGYSPMKRAPAEYLGCVEDRSGSTSPVVEADVPCSAALDVPLKAHLLAGNIGTFPLKSLVNIVRVRKLLDIKRSKLDELKELNCQAELTRAQGKNFSVFFRRKYATLILDLEKLNADMNLVLEDVNDYCRKVAPDEFPKSFSLLKDVSMSQAQALVSSLNVHRGVSDRALQPAGPSSALPRPPDQINVILSDENALQLITRVLALLLQIKSFADSGSEWNAYDLRALTDTLAETKARLRPANRAIFEASVEVQIRQVLAAMSHSRQVGAGLERIMQSLVEEGEPS